MAAGTDPPTTPPFDIVASYNHLLASDPDLTMPVAAIESLAEALSASTASTISETMDLLDTNTKKLREATPNPISLSAGTDLFKRYIITTLNKSNGSAGDFEAVRKHLLSNGRVFVDRAKASRQKIAGFGTQLIRDGATVLTNGGSRVVGALLRSAADGSGGKSSIRFKVIYVMSNPSPHVVPLTAKDKVVGKTAEGEGSAIVSMLRSKGIPVATIPESAVAYSMGKVSMVIVGAEGVVEDGGIISRLGTYQMGVLAKSAGKPFYVLAESHKFVRLFPLNQYDLPIAQRVIEFRVGDPKHEVVVETESSNRTTSLEIAKFSGSLHDKGIEIPTEEPKEVKGLLKSRGNGPEDAVDYTPPKLISGIITESGVLTPSAVSEELIKIWF